MQTTRPTPDKEAIALLPEFDRLGLDRITLVDTVAQAREAAAALRDHAAWGFDTESKPTFFKDQVSDGPHIVQLATVERAWVFQLHEPDCRAQVAALRHHAKGFLVGSSLMSEPDLEAAARRCLIAQKSHHGSRPVRHPDIQISIPIPVSQGQRPGIVRKIKAAQRRHRRKRPVPRIQKGTIRFAATE